MASISAATTRARTIAVFLLRERTAVLFLLAVVVATAGTRFAWQPRRAVFARSTIQNGRDVAMVFFVSSSCLGGRDERLQGALRELRRAIESRLATAGVRFASIGVSLDQPSAAGWAFLRRFGSFDEVVLGRNWLNSAAIAYLWRDLPGTPTIPQLVLIERSVEVGAGGLQIGSDRLLTRKVGVEDIVKWAKEGGVFQFTAPSLLDRPGK